MYGAILGDIIGSPYEFDQNNIKTKEFPLFNKYSYFTDDTIMTLAIADGFMKAGLNAEPDKIKEDVVQSMQKYGRMFPDGGYGARFIGWLFSPCPAPYNSLGNGSAMRVSSVAWLYDDLDQVRTMARISAEVTHNHPEGIKGAEATAAAIFLARTGHDKKFIKNYIEAEFDYDLHRTCDEIRPTYHHVETCMETVPEAIIAFLESTDFEDAIRNAVSLGGDCDTLTAITGSIAEAFYPLPDALRKEVKERLPQVLLDILSAFDHILAEKGI